MGLSEDSHRELEDSPGVRSLRVESDGRVVLGTEKGKVYLAEIIGC